MDFDLSKFECQGLILTRAVVLVSKYFPVSQLSFEQEVKMLHFELMLLQSDLHLIVNPIDLL